MGECPGTIATIDDEKLVTNWPFETCPEVVEEYGWIAVASDVGFTGLNQYGMISVRIRGRMAYAANLNLCVSVPV